MAENHISGSLTKSTSSQPLIDEIMKQIVWDVAKIHLQPCKNPGMPNQDDLCTIYTTFNGAYDAHFTFCATHSLMKRIAENMLEEPVTDTEEIIEYSKELVNILCGHIAASIFHTTKAPARFHSPCFAEGLHLPPDQRTDTLIRNCYTNGNSETAMLLHDPFLPILNLEKIGG